VVRLGRTLSGFSRRAATATATVEPTAPFTPATIRSKGLGLGRELVSMRMIPQEMVVRAVQVTSRFPATHGAPVHIGDPKKIGIQSLRRVNWGDPPAGQKGDVPVFWACGVTPQAVAMACKPELMITHSAGHMFLTDMRDEEWAAI